MTGSASKKRRAGEAGFVVGKAVLMAGGGGESLVYAAAVIRLAGDGRQEQDIQRQYIEQPLHRDKDRSFDEILPNRYGGYGSGWCGDQVNPKVFKMT